MKTVGPKLDHAKARVSVWENNQVTVLPKIPLFHLLTNTFLFQSLMDQYFGRMQSLTINKELPARIRFLLQNTVELRANHWSPRKAHVDNGPKTINQVRQDAVKVSLPRLLWIVWFFFKWFMISNINLIGTICVAGFGCFYTTFIRWNEEWLLHGELLSANEDQVWQGTSWWTGWYVWTNAWYVNFTPSPWCTNHGNILYQCCNVCCLVFGRNQHRYRSRGHSGPLFPNHGTSSHNPTLQWPCCKR